MEAIFDFSGQSVGWLDGESIFSEDGCLVALLNNGAVFAVKNGSCLGQFAEDMFRDRAGCVVAFVQGAWWCDFFLTLQETRMPPRLLPRTVSSHVCLPAAPPAPAESLMRLSSLDWTRFLAGRGAAAALQDAPSIVERPGSQSVVRAEDWQERKAAERLDGRRYGRAATTSWTYHSPMMTPQGKVNTEEKHP